jgi:hypothetical protein
MLLLEDAPEGYEHLWRKALLSLQVLEQHYEYSYYMHADDDSYCRLDLLLQLLVSERWGGSTWPACCCAGWRLSTSRRCLPATTDTHTPRRTPGGQTGRQPASVLLLGLHLGRHRQSVHRAHTRPTQQVTYAA